MRDFLAQTLAESPTREWMVYLLGNVPGLPPIAQSFHIMGIATVVGSIVMVEPAVPGPRAARPRASAR